jgi:Flp pilus assembly protein TadG
MVFRKYPRRRTGAILVENGFVLIITILMSLGLVVVGLGVSRYQQVAALAREAARWASVHGGQFAQDTGQSAATPSSVKSQVIPAYSAGLDPNFITNFTVTWDDPSEMPTYFDSTNKVWKSNAVHVTITYQWVPEAFFGGVTMTSTSEMPMAY